MTAAVIVIAGIFGLVFGSFVTALSYRLPRNISIAHGRSGCPACGHVLEWRDLFPVLSWAISGGRCRYCGVGISRRYPLIELSSAVLFAVTAAVAPDIEHTLILLAMIPFLLALTIIDLEHGVMPNVLMIPLAILALIWRWRTGVAFIPDVALGVGVAVVGLVLQAMTGKGDKGSPLIGGGDTKLLAAGAFAFSVSHFFLFLTLVGFIGCVFGAAWQLKHKTKRFPFAPGLCLGLWVVALIGDRLPF